MMVISGCSDPTLSEHGYEVFNRTTPHGPLEEGGARNGQVEWSSSYQAFVSRYQARCSAPPAQGPNPDYHLGVISAYTYDAMTILIWAIEQVAAVDGAGNLVIGRQALAKAVRATVGYQGATGAISFDSKGNRLP